MALFLTKINWSKYMYQKDLPRTKNSISVSTLSPPMVIQVNHTSWLVKYPVTDGVIQPANVPKKFVIPNNTPQKRGERSKWLALNPDWLIHRKPVPMTM